MKKAIGLFLLVFSLLSCKKETSEDYVTQGSVVERNTSIPVPFAYVKIMRSVPAGTFPGSFELEDVYEVQADANGKFVLASDQPGETIYAYTDPGSHYYSPTATAVEFTPGKKKITLSMIPYSWLNIRVVDQEPLNPEFTSVWVSLDFRGDFGEWEDVETDSEIVSGKIHGAQSFRIFYRLYTSPGVYDLRWIDTDFIPPHETVEVVVPY
ncbi:MAG: hypothetical protein IT223_06840 [Crocinitomicaceae bacterium]|nr:hypothetical protein [Crocinitomicaceae bacterium]